ncbi:MAG: hypothetical protein ABI588_10790, partial [Arenimonas sp.]
LAYAAVWRELVEYSAYLYSNWSRTGLLFSWLHGVHADHWFLLPIAAAGAAAGGVRAWRAISEHEAQEAAGFVLATGLLLGFAAVVLLMPHPPFPRTLVTYLPIWFSAIGAFFAMAVQAVRERRQVAVMVAVLVLSAGLLATQRPISSCRGAASSESPYEYDLCYQYFHDHYYPEAVVQAWAELGKPSVPIVTDYEGYFALKVLNVPGLDVYESQAWPREGLPVPLVVVHRRADFERISGELRLPAAGFVRVTDTGYFEIYAWSDYGARLPAGF